MIKGGTGGGNTVSGALFEEMAKGKAPGIPVHKDKLRAYFEAHTDKIYSLSMIYQKNTGLPSSEIPDKKAPRIFRGAFWHYL